MQDVKETRELKTSTDIIMGGRILRQSTFFLLCVLCISDASITKKPPSQAIKETKKLYYEENQMDFPYPMTTTIHQGNVPIVNPTTPGTSPIVNPTNPPSGPIITPTTPNNSPFVNPPIPPMGPTTGSTTPSTGGGGSWCIASPSASQTALQVALDYACGYSGADCSAIQPSGSCFEPNTLRDHASYAFNDFYQKHPGPTSCVFGGAAQLTSTDPGHGNCRYASSGSSPSTTPTTPMTPTLPLTPSVPMTPTIPMTPPSTTSPINPYTPGGSGGIGSDMPPPSGLDNGFEPAGTPNSAETISQNLFLLIAINFLILSVSVAYHS